MGHQLGAGLGVGVGVVAVQLLVLPVAPDPLPVPVDLVGGNIQKGLYTVGCADALQNVHRAHDIGFIGIHRVPVAVPDDGLGSQMQDNLRLSLVKGGLQGGIVPDVPDDGMDIPGNPGDFKQGRLRGGIQGKAGNLRAGQRQHPAQPRALEAGVSRDEHPFSPVKGKVKIFHRAYSSHCFHGARPDSHSCSSCCFSRRVSMHCQ